MTDLFAIDWPLCMTRGNHQAQQAQELLGLLVNELPQFNQQIQHAYDTHEPMLLSHHLKKCHDACCYTGVPCLQQHIEAALAQLNNGNWPSKACIHTIDQQAQQIMQESAQLHQEVQS